MGSKRLMFSHITEHSQQCLTISLSSEPGKTKLGQCVLVITVVTQFTGSVWCQKEKDSQQHFSSNLNFYDTVIV